MNINDYIVDQVLTDMSVGYVNQEVIYSQLMPTLEVNQKTGYYYVFNKNNFRIEDSRRGELARANRIGFGFTKASYGPLVEHSLEEAIEWEVVASYPSEMDCYADATADVSDNLELALEKEVADLVTATATITNNITLAGQDQFSDFANSDPFAVIQTGIDSVVTKGMVMPNTISMGYQVWSKLKNHPDLLGRLSVAAVRTLTLAMFTELFEMQKTIVGKAMYNTAKEGQAASMSFVWGKDILISYVAPTVKRKQITLGYILRLKGARIVDRWGEVQVKSDFVRATDNYEAKVISTDAAYLIKNAIA